MERYRPATTRAATALLAGLLVGSSGCRDSVNIQEVPLYEPAPVAADFPGIRYPAHTGPLPRPGAQHGPVWIVGVDGATWDLIRPLAESGVLPNLALLMSEGAWGALRSEEPTISPALWATVATGVPRHVHGIDNFLVKLPGSHEADEAGPLDRRSPALWEFVGATGGTSAVLSWFGSYPAEPIPGHYISSGFDPANLRPAQVHPVAFAAKLAASRIRLRPQDFEAIGVKESFQRSLLADARTLAALELVARDASPDLVLAYFAGIDVVQHTTWRHMDPTTQAFTQDGPADPGLAGVIPAYYRYIDHTLGQIRALMPANTTLLVLSDHGAGPQRAEEAYHFQLEVLLETLGLLDGADGRTLAIGELYRHDKRIWLNVAGSEAHGTLPPDEAQAEAASIARRLGALRADDGGPIFASIVDRTLDDDWRPGAPALIVRFSRSALLTERVQDGDGLHPFAAVRLRHDDVSGSHRKNGILLLAGPAIRPGHLAEPATLYNIAPTVLWLLGLPQDASMLQHAPTGGGVLTAALRKDALDTTPITMIDGYPDTDRSDRLRAASQTRKTAPDPARARSLEKLRSLGYIR